MGKRYHHLTLIEREQIGMLKAEGLSLRQVAKSLGRSHSTLVRELKKNDLIVYLPFRGYISAVCRRQFAKKGRSLKSAEVRAYVHEKIPLGWSPEQISGRIGKDLPGLSISHEAIYKYIYMKAQELIPQLTRRHRWRYRKNRRPGNRRMTIPNRVPISERPGEIEARTEFGHWESDSIVSRASREALNVLVERKSRFTQITRLQQMTSSSTRDVITQRLSRFSEQLRKSLTYDNGSENYQHEQINQTLGTLSYFCAPYHSWEKGLVENTNGLIRRFIPKKTDLAGISDQELARIEKLLNTRPRKCLGYQTPAEVLQNLGGALVS